ncbi:hypothetical protein GCM10025872_15180 [Barrientosiimonas endolithica]|uniref:Uncharacterized protein n=1 Tax=Barrientosiimonas endolithica TaxID=1535208 RepID=A0ABM8HAA4_9MICO|nr:hypothetical protein GCM10025872_15180 [Barrientosiimonas endolithica]
MRPRRDGRALLDEADRDFARVEWDDAEQRLGVSAGQSGDQLRTRWDIGCGICGDNVRARSERLDVVLDTLAEHGLGSISLSDVRATLNNVGRTT